MRLIGHLPDERLARRFADYLLIRSVASQVEPEADGQWAVWVHDDDHLDQAAAELMRYRAHPEESRYTDATAAAAERRRQEQQAAEAQARREFDQRRVMHRSLLERVGICTSLLILACLGVFLLQLYNEALAWKWLGIVPLEPRDGDKIAWTDAGFLPEVRKGQLWRLVTPIFIHGDLLHLLFNLVFFGQLGSAIERRYGWNRLLALVLFVSIFSNVLEYRFSGPAFCGMSGVVFGLFGFVWTQWKYYPNSGFLVPPHITFLMLFWFVFCIVGLGGQIANFVHWGGLASGALIGYVSAVLSRGP